MIRYKHRPTCCNEETFIQNSPEANVVSNTGNGLYIMTIRQCNNHSSRSSYKHVVTKEIPNRNSLLRHAFQDFKKVRNKCV